MKLTEWFPVSIKPVRVGVYDVDVPMKINKFSYWDGERWGLCGADEAEALSGKAGAYKWHIHSSMTVPSAKWRGIAK